MSNISGFIKRLRDIMRNDAGINGDAQRIEQIAWLLFLKVYDTKEQDWEFEDDKYQSIIPDPCRWRNWAHEEGGKGMTGDALLNFVNNILFPVLKGKDYKDANGNILIKGVQVDPSTPIKKAIVKTTFEDANTYMKDGVLLRQVINVIDELDLSDYEESHAFGEIYETILRELQSAGSSGEFYTPRAVTDFMAKMIDPQIGEHCADFACGTGGFLISWLKELETKKKSTDDVEKIYNSIFGIEKKQFPYILCVTNMLLHDVDTPNIRYGNALLHNVLDYTDKDKFEQLNQKLIKYEEISDRVEFEIASYLNEVSKSEISEESGARIKAMYKIIGEMESLGDSGEAIGRMLQRKNVHGKTFDEAMLRRLNKMMDLVENAYQAMIENLKKRYADLTDISNATDSEIQINEYRNALREEHIVNLESNSYNYQTGVFYMDIVSELEKMGDFIINISQAELSVASEK